MGESEEQDENHFPLNFDRLAIWLWLPLNALTSFRIVINPIFGALSKNCLEHSI